MNREDLTKLQELLTQLLDDDRLWGDDVHETSEMIEIVEDLIETKAAPTIELKAT